MRRTESVYDETWAIARLREVWEWAVAQKRPFVAYLLGMTILAFEIDESAFRPPKRAADKAAAAKAK
jgi:hypothetical protein